MKILDGDKDINLCVTQFEILLKRDSDINTLFEALDTVTHEYSMYVMKDRELGTASPEASRIENLRLLRDIFIDKGFNQ